jgi:NhaA family Na+:H+ antiporter
VVFLSILMVANRMGIRRTAFYALVGLFGVWTSFLFSGVHATIAGVLIALTIPARPKITEKEFARKVKIKIQRFEEAESNKVSLLTDKQVHCIEEIDTIADDAHTPLQKLEHALHPIVAFIILPVFALANAGIVFEGKILDSFLSPITLGIIFGLVLGKSIGITVFSWIALKTGIAKLPEGTDWKGILGAAFMAGIGFTMSIFIAELAFEDAEIIKMAKIGIFSASIISAIIGLTLLSSRSKKKAK